MSKITATDFGLTENERYNPQRDYYTRQDVDDCIKHYGSLISYSIDQSYDRIYSLLDGPIETYPIRVEYRIEYYCPSCSARYSFKGILPQKDNTYRQTTCLACGNTIRLGI